VLQNEVELVRRECGLHEFDVFNVGEAGHVMVKVGWIWMGADLLMDLEGCSTVKLPRVEYVGGGNGSDALKSFGQKRELRSEGFCLVMALAVSESVKTGGDAHVPFHKGSRWGLLRRRSLSSLVGPRLKGVAGPVHIPACDETHLYLLNILIMNE
jgi:hypothetical protein